MHTDTYRTGWVVAGYKQLVSNVVQPSVCLVRVNQQAAVCSECRPMLDLTGQVPCAFINFMSTCIRLHAQCAVFIRVFRPSLNMCTRAHTFFTGCSQEITFGE
jgi:hypothetical protein